MEGLGALVGGAPPTLLQTVRGAGGAGEVTCCDVSGGGARLLTGGGDRALRAWRWRGGAGWELEAEAPRAHRYGVTAARWSPGGALAASGGVDGAARVWGARDLAPRRLLAAPGAPALRALCWAGAGVLACGYDDGSARVWGVRRAELRARLHAHEGALHAVCAPARGALLLTACTDGVLKVFDLQEVCTAGVGAAGGEPAPLVWEDGAHDMGVLCCDVSADGRRLATGGQDARVRLWAVRGGGEGGGGGRTVEGGAVLEGHGAAVTAVRWGGGGVVASGALDRSARVWSEGGACLCVLHAHPRYLTCVALAPDLRYMVTGSNDKSVRMWALGDLTLDDELEPPCNPLAHFGIGDLEGIGPVDDEDLLSGEGEVAVPGGGEAGVGVGGEVEAAGEGGARLVWRSLDVHGGAINCISVCGDRLATACSDGVVRVFRWAGGALEGGAELGARGYPALAADLGAGGAVLLSAGLDGAARLWDVQSGCLLRELVAPAAADHESGGGGARGARVSPHRPPLLLLATDDGVAPLWSLADGDPAPTHVYGGHVEAALCCAWSGCGRVAAVGGAGGELRLVAPPPAPRTLCHVPDAHDLGVQSCDFAPVGALELGEQSLVLATAGSDALIKLWVVEIDEELSAVEARASCSVVGHGGGAASVRWGWGGWGGALVSAGADGWARVWRAAARGGALQLHQVAAVPTHAAASAAAASMLGPELVAVGSLAGELAVWRVRAGGDRREGGDHRGEEGEEQGDGGEGEEQDEQGEEPRWWGSAGVTRWIRDYITRVPEGEVPVCAETEAALVGAAARGGVTGARLLDDPLDELLDTLGYGSQVIEEEAVEGEKPCVGAVVRARLKEELLWLRRDPPPAHLTRVAPHWLLCPVSHALQTEPARAADGVTYDTRALHESFLAADGAVSPVSGRRLRNARVTPNYKARAALRDFLQQHDAAAPTDH